MISLPSWFTATPKVVRIEEILADHFLRRSCNFAFRILKFRFFLDFFSDEHFVEEDSFFQREIAFNNDLR
jgi:hypothetical protein